MGKKMNKALTCRILFFKFSVCPIYEPTIMTGAANLLSLHSENFRLRSFHLLCLSILLRFNLQNVITIADITKTSLKIYLITSSGMWYSKMCVYLCWGAPKTHNQGLTKNILLILWRTRMLLNKRLTGRG